MKKGKISSSILGVVAIATMAIVPFALAGDRTSEENKQSNVVYVNEKIDNSQVKIGEYIDPINLLMTDSVNWLEDDIYVETHIDVTESSDEVSINELTPEERDKWSLVIIIILSGLILIVIIWIIYEMTRGKKKREAEEKKQEAIAAAKRQQIVEAYRVLYDRKNTVAPKSVQQQSPTLQINPHLQQRTSTRTVQQKQQAKPNRKQKKQTHKNSRNKGK